MTSARALTSRLELIYDVVHADDPQTDDSQAHRRQWVQDHLQTLQQDTPPPHRGKCHCLAVPDTADDVVRHELIQAAHAVRAAEARRERLVAFAAQATSWGPAQIAQASGLNHRTVQRRLASVGGPSPVASQYVALRVEQEGAGQGAGAAEALVLLGKAAAGAVALTGEQVDEVARALQVPRRTVQRWTGYQGD